MHFFATLCCARPVEFCDIRNSVYQYVPIGTMYSQWAISGEDKSLALSFTEKRGSMRSRAQSVNVGSIEARAFPEHHSFANAFRDVGQKYVGDFAHAKAASPRPVCARDSSFPPVPRLPLPAPRSCV